MLQEAIIFFEIKQAHNDIQCIRHRASFLFFENGLNVHELVACPMLKPSLKPL